MERKTLYLSWARMVDGVSSDCLPGARLLQAYDSATTAIILTGSG